MGHPQVESTLLCNTLGQIHLDFHYMYMLPSNVSYLLMVTLMVPLLSSIISELIT